MLKQVVICSIIAMQSLAAIAADTPHNTVVVGIAKTIEITSPQIAD